jgi:hypothetical protein
MKRLLVCAALLSAAFPMATAIGAQGGKPVKTVESGVLDKIELFVDKAPAATAVVMRPFSATDADITEGEKKEETKTIQAEGPHMLAEQFVAKLRELGPFKDVSILDTGDAPENALVVSGKFIEADPGSRAKRYLVGFGSGKSGVTVQGSVSDAKGTTLATFQQRRVGVMGAFGGDSLKKLTADTKDIGEDLAKFLNAWATDKKLK